MQRNFRAPRKSPIIIGEEDHGRLSLLADRFAERSADLAAVLEFELDRARVVPDKRVPATVIRMGSTAVWRTQSGEEHRAKLVYPADADIANGRVSVLTPVGVALIGLSVGQQMEWIARDGRSQSLTVLRVETEAGQTG
jgi:regulator of nucleoside diphosphate kinase